MMAIYLPKKGVINNETQGLEINFEFIHSYIIWGANKNGLIGQQAGHKKPKKKTSKLAIRCHQIQSLV